MPPSKVLAVRHGESEWNVLRRKYPLEEQRYQHPLMYTPDCSMTAKGIQQSREVGVRLKHILRQHHNDAKVLWVVSPLRRALQTARHMLHKDGLPRPSHMLVHKECAEIMEDACDIGTVPSELAKEFPEFNFDLLTEDCWWPHGRGRKETWERMRQGCGQETKDMVEKRLASFRTFLQSKDEYEVVVVVCHSEVIWWLTSEVKEGETFGVWTENGQVLDISEHIITTSGN